MTGSCAPASLPKYAYCQRVAAAVALDGPEKPPRKSSEYNIAYLELHACSFDIIKRNVVKSHSYSTLLLLAAAHVHRAPLPCSALPKNEGRIENPHLEKFDDYLYECHC